MARKYLIALAALVALGLTFVTGYRLGRFAADEEYASRPVLPAELRSPPPPRRPVPAEPAYDLPPAPARTAAPPGRVVVVRRAPTPAAAPAPGDAPGAGGLITYPAPGYEGTRVFGGLPASPPVRDPRERPWGMVITADLHNLAAGKPVTSSDSEPLLGALYMITDGVKSCQEGEMVELASGTQYVQVDLATRCRIQGVGLWHYCQSPRLYAAVQIWISDDADFQAAHVVFNNDRQNLLGHGAGTDDLYLETHLGLLQQVPQVTGRYVRAYSRGSTANTRNHYTELEVYGQPL